MSEGVIDPLQAIDVTKDVANALLRMKTVQIGRERMAIVQPGQLVDPTLSLDLRHIVPVSEERRDEMSERLIEHGDILHPFYGGVPHPIESEPFVLFDNGSDHQ